MSERDGFRSVYVVMGSCALPYAKVCLDSMYSRCQDNLHVHIITDTESDRALISAELAECIANTDHSTSILTEAAVRSIAGELRDHEHFENLRTGHPCWRKITDPLLLKDDQEEAIVIDPDVYFPNYFKFPPTPATGIALMWQKPNCLLPPEVVERAFKRGIRLADHTDIGICQYRNSITVSWLDRITEMLCDGSCGLPNSMHVESIIWAAALEKYGGGHLEPSAWVCWANTLVSRVQRRFGSRLVDQIRSIDFSKVSAFHGGGAAKHVFPEAFADHTPRHVGLSATSERMIPYKEFSERQHRRKLRNRRLARACGLVSS